MRVNLRFMIMVVITVVLLNMHVFGQEARDLVNGNLIQFNDNGAWCWYQDERAIVDMAAGKLIIGSDASSNGVGGSSRNGRIEAVIYDLHTGFSKRFTFMQTGCDDHNAPAFLIRPDGKYIAMYAQHYDYYNSRYCIFDGENWTNEQCFDWTTIPGGTDYTIAYSNLYYLSAEGRMYNFARANHRCPNFIYSTDMGETWSFGGQLSTNNTNSYNKGYYKYWGNGVDRIDFICTEEHPRDGATSMYHGYIFNGKTHATDGTVVDENVFDAVNLPSFLDFTLIFKEGTVMDGKTLRKIWNADLMRYDDGTIAAILTSRINNNVNGNDSTIDPDHAFIYCRYDGLTWSSTYLGQAGKKMYSSEADYTGLGALHPNDPNTIYISTSIDPGDETDLGVREIFKGVTTNNGANWTWTPITRKSVRHNFRPIVPAWDKDNTALLWWRGTYSSAQRFDAAVVGILDRQMEPVKLMSYVDATPQNTFFADGSQLVTTGPNANQGATDNQWHERTGYGNGGSVLTSAEIGGENAPTLKTQVAVTEAGTYNVWINFWANPDFDWRIKAGLASSGMQIFRQMACKHVEDGDHNTSLILSGSNNTFLYQAYLGRIQVSTNNIIEIFVDDEAIQTGTQGSLIGDIARTWYDGISYTHLNEVVAVELARFSAKVNGHSVELSWETLTEMNNLGFEIERFDNEKWQKIGFVKGHGTATKVSSYSFIDNDIYGTSTKYRLKQIDFDGMFTYSNSIDVTLTIITNFELSQNHPNPFNSSTTITCSLSQDDRVNLKIYNLTGQEIATLSDEKMPAGIHRVTWNAQNIPSGVYFIKITVGNQSKLKKMMLLR